MSGSRSYLFFVIMKLLVKIVDKPFVYIKTLITNNSSLENYNIVLIALNFSVDKVKTLI